MQNERPQWLSVQQASSILGLSERGVLKRIHAGKLTAEKQGKAWRVLVAVPHSAASANSPGSSFRPDNRTEYGPDLVTLIDKIQQENTILSQRVGYLQAQLEQAQKQLEDRPGATETTNTPSIQPEVSQGIFKRLFGRR